MADKKAIIVGPPGVGKSLIFQHLVQKKTISSSFYPGTEIKILRGEFIAKKERWQLIDSPPIWSLNPISLNENIVLNLILAEKPDLVLQVMTPETVQQNLLISIHLSELGIPFLILLNKSDDRAFSDYEIDMGRLYSLFHAHLIVISVVLEEGLGQIKDYLQDLTRPRWVGQFETRVSRGLEMSEKKLEEVIGQKDFHFSRRFIVLMLFLKNQVIEDWLKKQIGIPSWKIIERSLSQDRIAQWSRSIQRTWQETAERLANQVVIKKDFKKSPLLNSLNKYAHHPFWGALIFAGVLIMIFLLLSKFAAGLLVNFLETEIFSKYVTPGFVSLISQFPISPFMQGMLVGEYGLFTMGLTYLMAIIFPIVFILFLVLAILEDSGYLSHLAILLNRFFSRFGLTGAASSIFLLGFGCSVLAVSKAKSLQTPGQHKIAAFLIVFAIPCIAQMGIIINMLSVIPLGYALLFIALIIAQLIIVGSFLKKFVPEIKGGLVQKVMTLRMPRLKNIWSKLWQHTFWYFRKAVPVFILATLFLFLSEASGLLELIQRLLAPIITPILGLPAQSVEVFVLGFLRRDYGAARLYEMTNDGSLNAIQVLVSLLVVTLSIPCVAAFLTLIKEQGLKLAMSIGLAIFFYTLALGSIVNLILRF
ncbi:MAG: 50S ribosome-binding GTPase [Candidatus Margulisbacteria bacterium]|nr:50S ribosome-binding GTPase [Candidatus Margulisiibacteriota bacterium]